MNGKDRVIPNRINTYISDIEVYKLIDKALDNDHTPQGNST